MVFDNIFLKRYKIVAPMLIGVTLLLGVGINGHAQVKIYGPTCVIPGLAYQYNINGNWNAGAKMQVCITGGNLSAGGSCTPDTGIISMVMVVWNDGNVKELKITSASGSALLSVKSTSELNGGNILEKDKVKVFDKKVRSYKFHCKAASGGSCRPKYQYQWQKSENGLDWTNIKDATNEDYEFSGSIIVNTYFRRVTTDSMSNSMAFSDSGQLSVVFE